MSVNRSKGQKFNQVRVYLETDVFAHGQLYIALSRVADFNNALVVKPVLRQGLVNFFHKIVFKRSGKLPGRWQGKR
jgi:hypothetical protein